MGDFQNLVGGSHAEQAVIKAARQTYEEAAATAASHSDVHRKPDDVPSTEMSVRYMAYANRAMPLMFGLRHLKILSKLRTAVALRSARLFKGGLKVVVQRTPGVGEAMKDYAPVDATRVAHGITWAYVTGDVTFDTYQAYSAYGIRGLDLARHTAERLTFHLFSSVLLPSPTIHTVVYNSAKIFATIGFFTTCGPAVCGLICILLLPYIFDDAVEYCVSNAYDCAWPVHEKKISSGL